MCHQNQHTQRYKQDHEKTMNTMIYALSLMDKSLLLIYMKWYTNNTWHLYCHFLKNVLTKTKNENMEVFLKSTPQKKKINNNSINLSMFLLLNINTTKLIHVNPPYLTIYIFFSEINTSNFFVVHIVSFTCQYFTFNFRFTLKFDPL